MLLSLTALTGCRPIKFVSDKLGKKECIGGGGNLLAASFCALGKMGVNGTQRPLLSPARIARQTPFLPSIAHAKLAADGIPVKSFKRSFSRLPPSVLQYRFRTQFLPSFAHAKLAADSSPVKSFKRSFSRPPPSVLQHRFRTRFSPKFCACKTCSGR